MHWIKDPSWLSRFYCHSWEMIASEYYGAGYFRLSPHSVNW